MGAFAATFGIRPWEWDGLSANEVLGLADYIDKMNEKADDDG